ncbi:MAG: CDP-glucose 4,6-dehydratase [Bdellovibrio sp.]
MFSNVYAGKKVLVTGHTGFKGSWLSLWLKKMGANVGGVSISVPTNPSHYELSNLKAQLDYEISLDICDVKSLSKVFNEFQPEILFHLAAEPIVSTCLNDPKLAFDTNLGGTVNVLECVKNSRTLRSVVIVTSDKCYENVEWDYGYRENDHLGGKDPYSASKACAEIAFSAYFRSYFIKNPQLKIASARAGNVIGGGDWGKDRIVPDCIRALGSKEEALIRNPNSTRPWQLVLEPLSGYLHLGAELYRESMAGEGIHAINGEAFNFGPRPEVEVNVGKLLQSMKSRWSLFSWRVEQSHAIQGKEAALLKLNCDKALRRLNWRSVLTFDETIEFLTDWYRGWFEDSTKVLEMSLSQIEHYEELAIQRGLVWTQR